MIGRVSVRRLVAVLGLTAIWCALWGEATLPNVLSGLAVGTLATARPMGSANVGGIRLWPLLQFGALVAVDIVASTLDVARETLRTRGSTEEAIVAVTTPPGTRAHLLLLVVAVTVTPGSAVVDTDADSGTLYLHLLSASRIDATKAHVQRLAELACEALPVPAVTPPSGKEVSR